MFAPPLTPEPKRASWFRKSIQITVLATLIFVLAIGCFFLQLSNYFLAEVSASPVEIYHNAWQAVRDNVYDRSKLAGWDQWEHKYDDKIKTDADALFYAQEMVASLGDPYSFIMNAEETKASYTAAHGKSAAGIGVEIELQPIATAGGSKVFVSKVLRGGPAMKSGIKAGDTILKVENKSCLGIDFNELAQMLQGEPGSKVQITVERNGQTLTQTVERGEVVIPIVSSAVLPGNIGYLRIDSFVQLDTDKQVFQALKDLKDCKSLVVDIRDNPGGFIHTSFMTLSLFIDEGLLATEHVQVPASSHLTYFCSLSRHFIWLESLGIPIPLPRYQNLSDKRPLVILINGHTASAAEIFAGALKDHGRATLIGQQTFGKGVGQTFVPIGGGSRLRITNFRTTTPSGQWVGDGAVHVANGITPNVQVDGTFDRQFVDLQDPPLNAALEFLNKQ